ncbi:MAG TPA: ABC transporter ATP-binding protein [Candidatus Omnitrophota bacterium]|nr:ABC transporter ATP-binding protein [Candidatus Omnitrophota bacterium]
MKKKSLIYKVSFAKLLKDYARPLWKHICALIVITLVGNFFTVVQPVIVSGVVQLISDYKGGPSMEAVEALPQTNVFNLNNIGTKVKALLARVMLFDGDDFWNMLIFMLSLFLVSVFLSALINYLALVMTRWIRVRSTEKIRKDVLDHLLSLNIGFYNRQKSGELISRVVQDAQNTGQGLGPLVRGYIHHGVLIAMYSTYLISTSVWMTLCAFGMITLQFGLTEVIKRPVRRTTRCFFDRIADLTSSLQEMMTNIRVIKSFGVEDFELRQLGHDLAEVSRADFKEGLVRQVEPYAREFLDATAFVGIFLVAAFQLMKGSLSLQGFLLYIYVGRLLIEPVNKFAVCLTWTQALLASYERLDELFQERTQVVDGTVIKADFKDRILVKNVLFRYLPNEDFSLDGINFELKKGEVIAFVGPSGAGKSTLTDLLLRFYDPQKGLISIDGVDLRNVKISAYRKIFGVVPQESLLFNDTVANNIVFGREGVSRDDIVAAAKLANAHEFILDLPDGYETFLGDRGVRLSGGQRQRIAIARAIVAKPDILIFDEATSSLDTQSEQQVQKAIDSVLECSTAVVIAHRLSTILHADKIAVLNKGRIEAMGRHAELLEISPLYRQLYQLQFDMQKDLIEV